MKGGLTSAEAARSRAEYGSNELSAGRKNSFWRQFVGGFGDPIIKVLLAALAMNLLFFFHHFDWYESVGIALAIFLSTFVSALSEHGSESAFEQLQKESARVNCRVWRDGKLCLVPIAEVVVGDLVSLMAGERVPADGWLLEGGLSLDQSALNGESREIKKRPASTFTGDLAAGGDLFRGSVVVGGSGVMRVARVGAATLYGGVAGELHETSPESPLKRRLSELAATISRMGYIAAALVASADLFHSFVVENTFSAAAIAASFTDLSAVVSRLLHAATLAVTMIVVAVPEGLPMMITVVLSANIRKMLRDRVLVRRPVGIETAGNLNILFTDKTGTLTGGKLTVTRFVSGNGEVMETAALRRRPIWKRVAMNCAAGSESAVVNGRAVGGNATDRALTEWTISVSPPAVSARLPFDSTRKMAAVRLQREPITLWRGAPEKLIGVCSGYYDTDGTRRPLTSCAAVKDAWRTLTTNAMRVVALCEGTEPISGDTPPTDLTLVGLIGIRDDVRRGVDKAVAGVRGAGIQTVMITGDNRDTAVAIAREAGVLTAADPDERISAVTGAELQRMSDEELQRRLPQLRVVARALPADKSRLVRAAQAQGLVAGMTGDGVNDAPALKKADVGFAMGSGTEVAKEAGDIVILDDNFASIARAVLYGRTIFKSIRKFIVFQLTMNLCAAGVSVIGPFIGIETPVTVIQMLWINLIMDTLAGLAFAGEAPIAEYMEEPPKSRDEAVLDRSMVGQILGAGGYTLALCLLFLKWEPVKMLFRATVDPLFSMSAFFALFVFSGIANSFNARTTRANPFANLRRNPAFLGIMAAVALVQIGLLYFGGSLFRTAPLTVAELFRVLLLATSVIPAECARKLLKSRRK